MSWDFFQRLLPGSIGVRPGKGFALGSTALAALPICNASRNGEMRRVPGLAGVADQYVTCRKNAADAHAWVQYSESTRAFVTLGPWHLNAVTATATNVMLLSYAATATTVALGSDASSQLRMPTAGAVIGGFLITDAARTGGTATLSVRINGSNATLAAGACVINATHTLRNAVYDPANGVAFATGDTVAPNIVTSGYSPTADNWTAWLIVTLAT